MTVSPTIPLVYCSHTAPYNLWTSCMVLKWKFTRIFEVYVTVTCLSPLFILLVFHSQFVVLAAVALPTQPLQPLCLCLVPVPGTPCCIGYFSSVHVQMIRITVNPSQTQELFILVLSECVFSMKGCQVEQEWKNVVVSVCKIGGTTLRIEIE